MLIFVVRRLLSLKNCQMRPQNIFLRISLKIQLFSKKLLNEKIFSIKFLIKKAIFIFGVRWPLTGRTVTQLDVLQTKWGLPLQPLLLRSEISLFWRISCAWDFTLFPFSLSRHFNGEKVCFTFLRFSAVLQQHVPDAFHFTGNVVPI